MHSLSLLHRWHSLLMMFSLLWFSQQSLMAPYLLWLQLESFSRMPSLCAWRKTNETVWFGSKVTGSKVWLLAPLFTSCMFGKVSYHFKLMVYWYINPYGPTESFLLTGDCGRQKSDLHLQNSWPYLKGSSFQNTA